MGTYFKNNKAGSTDDVIEIEGDNWDLDVQLQTLEKWLKENSGLNFTDGEWIVDIGFEPRTDSTVTGYTISVELMTLLVKRNITLWISDYRSD